MHHAEVERTWVVGIRLFENPDEVFEYVTNLKITFDIAHTEVSLKLVKEIEKESVD